MSTELIISVSGLRGIVGDNLTEQVAIEYGCAFGTFLKARKTDTKTKMSICIGRDSRTSGEQLTSAVSRGLCSVGIDVIDLGLVPTPTVGIMLRELGCDGGVVITASHNPAPYNGIKLLLDNGIAPTPGAAGDIKKRFLDKDFNAVDSADQGKITANARSNVTHISRIMPIIDKQVIRSKSYKVALDSVNGAGGPITKEMLAELNCEVVAINDEPTGRFAHTPEPTVDNVTELCKVVKKQGAAVGFAQDPDADRLAIVDENGTYIGEEYTLALAAKYIFSKQTGPAATNLSTSRMIDDIAEAAAGHVIRTAVGEANVAAAMIAHDCVIGGEGNGGVIDLRVGPIRDSLVAIALILQLMTETGKTISQLVGQINRYYMCKEKCGADKTQAKQVLASAKKVFVDARLDTTDGCRFDFDDGWLHLRTSNTEPVMRVIVEAKDRRTAETYIDAVSNIRNKILGPTDEQS